MIVQINEILNSGKDLSAAQMGEVMEEIMGGGVATAEIVSFLEALSRKGETVEELTAAVAVMRTHVIRINTCKTQVLDTCGTGGDAKGTFNISTAAAFVAAGAGVTVAKHGNRSVSSRSGSADILEALGININLSAEKIEECLEAIGIAFLFAQNLHPAMKYAAPARKEIGKRTMFNILGPISNPAGAAHQLVGVFDKKWLEPVAQVLLNSGAKHSLVVHGFDGLDEITTTDSTYVAEAIGDKVKTYVINPHDYGIERARPEDLKGGNASSNARILVDILRGKPGPMRDITVFNAAAGIYAADKAGSINEALELADKSITQKKALEKLLQLKEFSLKSK